MPVKSKAQFRLMQAVRSGSIKLPGMTKNKAAEMVQDNIGSKSYKNLPKFSKLKKLVKNG